MAGHVKPPLTVQQERSAKTRQRIIDAAYRLFADRGYAATTLDAIAVDAGVAVQTVKFVFHTKAQVLLGVIDAAAAAGDPLPVVERPWFQEAIASTDDCRTLALMVDHGTDIYVRLAALTDTIRTAASLDAEVAEQRESTLAQRRRGLEAIVDSLHEMRTGLTTTQATDVVWVLQSPETFHAFTEGCGWEISHWKSWQYETLCHALLGPTTPAARRRGSAGFSWNP